MQIPAAPNPTFDAYYQTLNAYAAQGVTHEQATRLAFTHLLEAYAKPVNWTLVLEQRLSNGKIPDGTLLGDFRIPRGYWEAKDTADDLDAEIRSKIKIGYPTDNIIFEDTRRGVLYQNRQKVLEADLRRPSELADLLSRFFNHTRAQIEEFHKAVAEFETQIPVLAGALMTTIAEARQDNPTFRRAFDDFHALCKTSLNPGIGAAAIEEMLAQHLLTERLFRNVFDNPEFTHRNVIAQEIERVIDALTSRSFSRQAFLQKLDFFYDTIEATARTISDFSEKQGFLNAVYERFFQGFSKATADTHGIVYTPQPIVDFMCESVEHVLQTEFGTSLSGEGVTILDPCTGTGNFLVNLLRRIGPLDLERKYKGELFANEVMLLPYYIASLNIEHAYFEKMGRYLPFEGVCFADTLDLAEGKQLTMEFSERNSERVKREKAANITVIIGNPPYNVGQQNENDNNKNRPYAIIDNHIKQTYVKASKATLNTKLYDAYVRFFRWATDRLGDRDGVICFVTNNGFMNGIAFDGFRKHLAEEFTSVYHLDLGGNARKQGGGSVFGIRVGAGITILVRRREGMAKPYPVAKVFYHALNDMQSGVAKLAELGKLSCASDIEWQQVQPDARHNWLNKGIQADFDAFLPLGTKAFKSSGSLDVASVFKTYSLGVSTNRDSVAYDFKRTTLSDRVKQFINDYDAELTRWKQAGRPKDVDNFVSYDKVKWSRNLKSELRRAHNAEYDEAMLRRSSYRPFTVMWLYYGSIVVDEHGLAGTFFPTPVSEDENTAIVMSDHGHRAPFSAIATNALPDLHMLASTDGFQCFPLYTYTLDGKIRRDNITDWALGQFRDAYGPDVTKRDIFHYVYALLHHPQYRAKYAENLKRELPRVPLVGKTPTPAAPPLPPQAGEGPLITTQVPLDGEQTDKRQGIEVVGPSPFPKGDGVAEGRGKGLFRAFADAGAKLAALHVGYEDAAEYPLRQVVSKDVPFSWRVTKMRLTPDKTAVKINESFTLAGVPPEAFAYRLGNRSALEWVLDQYQVTTDKRSGIVSDPNRAEDPGYIARLVRQVVTVSVETVKCINALPPLDD